MDETPKAIVPGHEYSAWMKQAASERLAELSAAYPRIIGQLVKTPLGVEYLVTFLKYDSRPGDGEDRRCDRCRKYVPPMDAPDGDRFFTIMIEVPSFYKGIPTVMLCAGLCRTCAAAEYGPDHPLLSLDGAQK